MPNDPLIVTAKMDSESFEFFNELRQKHFPYALNQLSAHITLFHHLPCEHLEEIEEDLKITSSRQYEFELRFSGVKFIESGTIIEIESPPLISLRNKLANHWSDYLALQNSQKFAPHITIQNKIPSGEARLLYENLKGVWRPRIGTAVALQVWYYRNSSLQLANEFDFYKIIG